jgi:hypothetical protein
MLDKQAIEKIKEHLFSEELNTYAVIDGAACPELRFKIYDWEPQSTCLWSGELEPDLQEVAPYMVLLDRDSTFTDWLITQGWDNHWNIFITSRLNFKAFRKQIRKLLLVKSPEGQNMVFRFYDPRVMEMFLPTCSEEQLKEIFTLNCDICFFTYDGQELSVNKLESSTGEIISELHPLAS